MHPYRATPFLRQTVEDKLKEEDVKNRNLENLYSVFLTY